MENERRGLQAALARLAAQGADAARIADTAVATWLRIDAALSPIVGQGGVATLYQRSLYLKRLDHPWLMAAYEAAIPGNFDALHTALSRQTSATAAAANAELLQTLHELLTSLIGASLTERLLQSVWDHLSSGDAVRDNTP